jgi:hypothetical protein
MMLDARVPPTCGRKLLTDFRLGTALLLCSIVAMAAAGCATDKLVLAPPAGVDLTGEWVLDTNLSDDPSQVQEPEKSAAQSARDDRDNTPTAFGKPGSKGADNPLAAGGTNSVLHEGDSASATPASQVDASAMVDAPQRMSITQHGSEVHIQAATADGQQVARSFKAGATQTIPWPHGGAECSAAWRGPAFVVTTRPKKGRNREDDYALDDQGHLILTIQTRKLDIKLVYGRPRT